MRHQVVALLLVIGLLNGCGKDEDSPQSEQPLASQLVGDWNSSCTRIADGRYEIVEMQLEKERTFRLFQLVYSSEECDQQPMFTLDAEGRYSVLEEPGEVDRDGTLRLVFQSYGATIGEGWLDLARAESFCGISDWQAGTSRSILGSSCEYVLGDRRQMPDADGTVEEAVAISATNLYLSDWLSFPDEISRKVNQGRYLRKK